MKKPRIKTNKSIVQKSLFVFFLITLLLFLPSCGKKNGDIANNDPKNSGQVLVFQDPKEEIQVTLKNGLAEIAYAGDDSGPKKISGLKQKIIDVKISYVQRIEFYKYENWQEMDYAAWPKASVFLLLENGQVAWLPGDPEFSSEATILPFIENIDGLYTENLVYDSDDEFYGMERVYAQDDMGLIYYLEHPVNLRNLFKGTWIAPLVFNDYNEELEISGYLKFMEDGQVTFQVAYGWEEQGQLLEAWHGHYEFILAEEQEWQPQTLLLDLDLSWWIYEAPDDMDDPDFGNDTIRSVWWSEFGPSDYMGLFNSDGDTLFKPSDDDFYYSFWQFEDLEFQ